MESFPLFLRIRAITFICIMLFSFLWLVLLCVETFARWSVSDQINRSLVILFILANTITLIMLPILILVEFRIWLDAARLLLLFVFQAGSAAAGAYWSPKIQCPDQTPDDVGVCQLIGVYTMIACWIIPAILVFYSIYFAVTVYLQSRIPVVVERKHRSGVDPEMGSTDSLSLWREKVIEITGVQGTSTDTSAAPRPLVLPSMVHAHAGPSSLPRSSTPQHQSTLSNAPRRQSTMPSLPHTSRLSLPTLPFVPNRHQSLPAFKHGNATHLRPLLTGTSTMPHPLANNVSPSQPQTPSSYTHSTSSPANSWDQSFGFGPSVADVQFPRDHRGSSRHLSLMPLSSSPREMQSAEGSPTTPRSMRARLSKPPPAHLMQP